MDNDYPYGASVIVSLKDLSDTLTSTGWGMESVSTAMKSMADALYKTVMIPEELFDETPEGLTNDPQVEEGKLYP